MALESGGRTDKLGNRFELRYCVLQILRVIEEELSSVTIEALGDDEIVTDIWIEKKDGFIESQQCKSRNGNSDNWSFSALSRYDIFKKWKFQLDRGPNYHVSLVSPISFVVFEDLIKRAKNTSDNPKDFYDYQIKNSENKMLNFYNNYCYSMGIDLKEEKNIAKSINYLQRSNYHQIPDEELTSIIHDKIKYLLIGDSQIIYDYFADLIINGNIFAKKIDLLFIENFLMSKNIQLRDLTKDKRIFPRIIQLNDEYDQFFIPINGELLKREEFIKCKDIIDEGNSIIIHGKAGYGKSGITQLIIEHCKNNNIPYLAIKLDKRIPKSNVELWSNELGLPTSISFCLDSISRNKKAVIVLDQLDALRWTQTHSRDALLVCSELIEQVRKLNYERKEKISIIFVCRTYDLENDNNIKSLFKDNNNIEKKKWKKIDVGKFSEDEVKSIIGNRFDSFSKKLKEILKIPSNLYIFKQLDPSQKYDDCTTTNNLIQEWWEQLLKKSNEFGISEEAVRQCKDSILKVMEKDGRISTFRKLIDCNNNALEYLSSNGFLIINDNMISFTHQSILDYFLEENMLKKYQDGENIEKIVGDKSKQNTAKRYQVQMFLEDLATFNTQDFINIGKQLLISDEIRFFIKHVFFEVLGQIETIDDNIEQFIIENCDNSQYSQYILNNVINAHPQFIRLLMKEGILDKWMNKEKKKDLCINILFTIKEQYCIEDVKFIEKYMFKSEIDDKKLYRCFNYDINDDLDELFELRMKLYNKYPELSDVYIDFKKMLKAHEIRAIRLIRFWLDNKIRNKNKRIYQYEEELITDESDVIVNNAEKIISILLPCVPKKFESEFEIKYGDWSGRRESSNGLERSCVELIKKANTVLIKQNPEKFLEIYRNYMGKGYPIYNELILDGLQKMPTKYSNSIIKYLYSDFDKNVFDETSNNLDGLQFTKEIVKKHAVFCDDNTFKELEKNIYFYKEKDMISLYKRIREYKINYTNNKMAWDFWGNLQIELIPTLPCDRLSIRTKQLYDVLKRKFKNGSSLYRNYRVTGGFVSSPITNKKLSNKQWLKLISNSKLKSNRNHSWKKVNGRITENSIEDFARSFSDYVAEEPELMINLVLNNKKIVLNEFTDALYNGLIMSEKIDSVPIELLEKLFIELPCDNESRRANCICEIINKKNDINWSQTTINILNNIAINHKDPVIGQPNITCKDDDEIRSIDMLQSNSINCARGEAAQTIGHILWNRKDLFINFKDTIDCLSKDINPVIRFACLHCLLPTYNIEREWAREKILDVFEKDIRAVAFWNVTNILFLSYQKEKSRVLRIIDDCYNSHDKDLRKIGAYCIAEMYIIKGEYSDTINNITNMDDIQKEAIIQMLMNYYDNHLYKEKVKDIIEKFNASGYDLEYVINRLFYGSLLNLNEDKDFIILIMKNSSARRSLYSFIHYIDENALSIIDFRDIIFEVMNSFIENKAQEQQEYYFYGEELEKLIIGLYDETIGKEDKEMKETFNRCLDMIDKLFEIQIGSIRSLCRQMLDR